MASFFATGYTVLYLNYCNSFCTGLVHLDMAIGCLAEGLSSLLHGQQNPQKSRNLPMGWQYS